MNGVPKDDPLKATEKTKRPKKMGPPPPPVKHTLTSYRRMLKANPLLQLEQAGIDVGQAIAQKSLDSLSQLSLRNTAADNMPGKSSLAPQRPHQPPLLKRTQSLKISKPQERPFIQPKQGTSQGRQALRLKSTKETQLTKKLPNRPTQKQTVLPKINIPKLNKSTSEELLCAPTPRFPEYSPIEKDTEAKSKAFVFKTPKAYDRRSVCHVTPFSEKGKRTSLFQASTPAPLELSRLQDRLDKWLKSRGKPPARLSCFRIFSSTAIPKSKDNMNAPTCDEIPEDNENKENIENIPVTTGSYEDLGIIAQIEKVNSNGEAGEGLNKSKEFSENSNDKAAKESNEVKDLSEQEIAKYAREAMAELQLLIEDDYPQNQCLGWLELIREKYRKIEDEPEYWECRAAIERSIGNVHQAVEYYKNAIIQGAEVTTVDKSLDHLLEKFSLLNITTQGKDEIKNGQRERIVREARETFKSTIIQFAIMQRNTKKEKGEQPETKRLVAIPVRRSTRLSRGFANKSGITLCSSLKDLSLENIEFEKNKALC